MIASLIHTSRMPDSFSVVKGLGLTIVARGEVLSWLLRISVPKRAILLAPGVLFVVIHLVLATWLHLLEIVRLYLTPKSMA
jgi:hypothetical protein